MKDIIALLFKLTESIIIKIRAVVMKYSYPVKMVDRSFYSLLF